jgi:phosphocarrier protein
MIEKVVTVRNPLGLHLRTSGVLAQVASRYVSHIYVQKGAMKVDAKSIISVVMLAAGAGTKLKMIADGPDEAEAIEELAALVESRFDEAYPSS